MPPRRARLEGTSESSPPTATPDRANAKTTLTDIISTLAAGVPAALSELITLGRTLTRRATDVVAYFDRPGTSNGPTEAINGSSDSRV